jgi:hypothetical protein
LEGVKNNTDVKKIVSISQKKNVVYLSSKNPTKTIQLDIPTYPKNHVPSIPKSCPKSCPNHPED